MAITVPEGMHAIANTPEISREPAREGLRVRQRGELREELQRARAVFMFQRDAAAKAGNVPFACKIHFERTLSRLTRHSPSGLPLDFKIA